MNTKKFLILLLLLITTGVGYGQNGTDIRSHPAKGEDTNPDSKEVHLKTLVAVENLLNESTGSQSQNSTGHDILNVSGAVTITNNGISFIPALSLDKPATIFNLSFGKRLRYEPELRFSLEGEPWSFSLRVHYDMVKTDKFQVRVSARPAVNFRTVPSVTNGVTGKTLVANRVLGGELNTSYHFTRNAAIGIHYIYGRGLDTFVPDHANFISLNTGFSYIPLFNDITLRVTPQIYYLNVDGKDGFYLASGFRLGKRDFPLSISSLVNRSIETEIRGNPDLVWNVGLNYAFNF